MLAVGANAGLSGMAVEHLDVTLALSVPTFVVVTKVDMAPKRVRKATLKAIAKHVRAPGVSKMPVMVRSEEEAMVAARNILSSRITPIFEVSSVSGAGLATLKTFLNLLPLKTDWAAVQSAPPEFAIEETFVVAGVGTVVSGVVRAGTIVAGDSLLLGPDSTGGFTPVIVKSIQVARSSAKAVAAGQTASLALKRVKRQAVGKGMMLLDAGLAPQAHYEFEAHIRAFSTRFPIRVGHEAVIHTGTTRATARVESIFPAAGESVTPQAGEVEVAFPVACADGVHEAAGAASAAASAPGSVSVSTTTESVVRFRFLYQPHYLRIGERVVFREGCVKGVGNITGVGGPPELVLRIAPSKKKQ
ncbi:GTP-binding protein 1 [Thecamonas trahens ATCC 50062]|uniref:GTP-binding protein 1 n=1 Tax=Thecamonas trahens ATCC 50062 TaxID=461836 RepID=A0A0L0D5K5_THETB|nr:GTP-binding protein 1 [Thecamonas trahens ATCC 50062]KNC47652.1 GTP-binding protein 1 [Thecamonas trahens ATCC 50062]|eukprot:XP_013759136.1 GTP-binding protein 1 [Thecamonas trahens ATCC 50062]